MRCARTSAAMLEAMGRGGEERALSSLETTDGVHAQSNDLSRSLAALGPAAGSFTIDFPEHRQASGWRRFLPWVFGLLTLLALVLVVLHFGTIEQFTGWLGQPALSGSSSHALPKQQPMGVHLWCGDRRYGVPGTHDRSALSFPLACTPVLKALKGCGSRRWRRRPCDHELAPS